MATTTHTAAWGVSGSVTGVTGVVQEIRHSNAAVLGTEQNELGAVIGQVIYDKKKTLTATILVASGTSLPEEGSAMTIDGVSCYCVNASIIESNTSYRRISVTAEAFTNCTATSAATAGA